MIRSTLAAGAAALLTLLALASPVRGEGLPGTGVSGPAPREGTGLIMWDGGSVEELHAAVMASGGCRIVSAWVAPAGAWAGYVFGAPALVNRAFLELHPGGVLPAGPLLVVCERPSPWVAGVDLDAVYEYALELINEARADAGVAPVTLGTNLAAQRHAEDLAEHCALSHWGSDGLLPYMRYSLAGGYDRDAENVSAWARGGECRASAPDSDVAAVRRHTQGLLGSSGHRATVLKPQWLQVHIGYARRGESTFLVQQFAGDYVALSELPRIDGGVLTLAGSTANGASLVGSARGTVRYHPFPQTPSTSLSGQTYAYGRLRSVGTLSVADGHITVAGDRFGVRADLAELRRDPLHGPGVYTVSVFGETSAGPAAVLEEEFAPRRRAPAG